MAKTIGLVIKEVKKETPKKEEIKKETSKKGDE